MYEFVGFIQLFDQFPEIINFKGLEKLQKGDHVKFTYTELINHMEEKGCTKREMTLQRFPERFLNYLASKYHLIKYDDPYVYDTVYELRT